jgi:folate-dependent phosphoribosylglycinamide formyltransferase PurN
MALVWFALWDRTGDSRFLNAALKAIDLVKRAQPMSNPNPGIRGGIPGSDPIWGDYIRMALPNWAAKFFIDALLVKRAAMRALAQRPHGVAAATEGVPHSLPEVRTSAPGSPPRVVVLASASSKKVARMLREWDWGFRPAAVVVSSGRQESKWDGLRDRIREQGLASSVRHLWSRHPSTPVERGATRADDVRTCCRDAAVPVIDVDSLDSGPALDAIRKLQPDLCVFAGGGILRAPLLAIPRLGTLNAHMGLLPFYRGMNVAEWARFHGDPVGCSVHLIDSGIDTGDILCVRHVSTAGARSIEQLRRLVDQAQIILLGEVVRYVISSGTLPPGRAQSRNEGRQFFRMHRDLADLLERELAAGNVAGLSVGDQRRL